MKVMTRFNRISFSVLLILVGGLAIYKFAQWYYCLPPLTSYFLPGACLTEDEATFKRNLFGSTHTGTMLLPYCRSGCAGEPRFSTTIRVLRITSHELNQWETGQSEFQFPMSPKSCISKRAGMEMFLNTMLVRPIILRPMSRSGSRSIPQGLKPWFIIGSFFGTSKLVP